MNTRFLLPVAALFAALAITTGFSQKTSWPLPFDQTSVSFPRDQIALQLGAIQMGYVTNGSPFNPTNQQRAANALAQGRIALSVTNGFGTNNVVGATQPTNYGAQLDAAVLAVMASPATKSIIGRARLANGKSQTVAAKLSPPSPDWTVPLPYAISALTAGPQGPQGPVAITPPLPTFTSVVRAGDWIIVSGQLGIKDGALVEGGVAAQTTQVVANLKAQLELAGAGLGDVAKTLCFLTDMDANTFAAFNAAYVAGFGSARPARSTVGVDALPLGGVVEIEAWAFKPE